MASCRGQQQQQLDLEDKSQLKEQIFYSHSTGVPH